MLLVRLTSIGTAFLYEHYNILNRFVQKIYVTKYTEALCIAIFRIIPHSVYRDLQEEVNNSATFLKPSIIPSSKFDCLPTHHHIPLLGIALILHDLSITWALVIFKVIEYQVTGLNKAHTIVSPISTAQHVSLSSMLQAPNKIKALSAAIPTS